MSTLAERIETAIKRLTEEATRLDAELGLKRKQVDSLRILAGMPDMLTILDGGYDPFAPCEPSAVAVKEEAVAVTPAPPDPTPEPPADAEPVAADPPRPEPPESAPAVVAQWDTAAHGILGVLDAAPAGLTEKQIQESLAGRFRTISKTPEKTVYQALRMQTTARGPVVVIDGLYRLREHQTNGAGAVPRPAERTPAPPQPSPAAPEVTAADKPSKNGDEATASKNRKENIVRYMAIEGPKTLMQICCKFGLGTVVAQRLLRCPWFDEQGGKFSITNQARAEVIEPKRFGVH